MRLPDGSAPSLHAGAVSTAPHRAPSWLTPYELENLYPVLFSLAVAATLQLLLPARFVLVHPGWLLPALEFALVAALIFFELLPRDISLRRLSLVLVALVSADNALSSLLLVGRIVSGNAGADARSLLASGGSIWVTNVIVYGVWYWQMDRGGPRARAAAVQVAPDFMFPQMQVTEVAPKDWRPYFLDYLYVSFTNATAFSPTDTMPLTRRAKSLMALQSLVSLVTVALVLARAVNILG